MYANNKRYTQSFLFSSYRFKTLLHLASLNARWYETTHIRIEMNIWQLCKIQYITAGNSFYLSFIQYSLMLMNAISNSLFRAKWMILWYHSTPLCPQRMISPRLKSFKQSTKPNKTNKEKLPCDLPVHSSQCQTVGYVAMIKVSEYWT